MDKSELIKLRVLVADPSPYLAGLTTGMLRTIGIKASSEVYSSGDVASALSRLPYDIIILDRDIEPGGGVAITRRLRTQAGLNRDTPVVLTFAEINEAQLLEARDAGVTEFIRKPMSAAVLELRLKATLLNPREFVDVDAYTGPDRRRRSVGPATGSERRRGEA
jgi:two-component system chemotaxis response regulator CheY